ncbi:MAG: metallophosphoesterase [Lachnospiraceae bacterium]|nr:metallophosphoesterase [Lachnospiraceae bacterium]
MNIFLIIFIILLILGILAGVIMFIDCHRLVVREYNVSSPKLKKDLDIILLTDLHSKSLGRDNSKLVEKIDSIKPDLILVAGDMYTAAFNDKGTVAIKLFKEISSRYPIYYSNGNHEQKTKLLCEEFNDVYEGYLSKIKEMGINHLTNESTYLADDNIRIFGLELPFLYYRKRGRKMPGVTGITDCIGTCDDNAFNLMIAHNPLYFDDYADWGADLVLSGHVHGGLMRLPYLGGVLSPNYRFFPKYSGGRYEKDGSVMVLSCGLGTHHIPARINNPAELSLIHLKTEVI